MLSASSVKTVLCGIGKTGPDPHQPESNGSQPGATDVLREPLSQPPPLHMNGCVPLSHQVAGHRFGVSKTGILQHPDGAVLKQLQPPPRGPREMRFYDTVYAEDCRDPRLLELRGHLPGYHGTWSSPDSPEDLYLKLEDVTRRFARPCIMDVKLGRQSYDPFDSREKQERQIRKYPLMEEIGFRVLGMRVYEASGDTFHSYDGRYGIGLVRDTLRDGLARFFHNGAALRRDAVLASVVRARRVLRWFESQRQLLFYSSSLLFVYEGLLLPSSSSASPPGIPPIVPPCVQSPASPEADDVPLDGRGPATVCVCDRRKGDAASDAASSEEDNSPWKHAAGRRSQPNEDGISSPQEGRSVGTGETERRATRRDTGKQRREGVNRGGEEVEVRMIDFAHVFSSDSHDHGYIYGLKHLLAVLEQILHESS